MRTMAAIHDKLYRSQVFGQIDARDYVTSLVDELLRSDGLPERE